MPKLGESVQEATITKWFKKKGDSIKEENILLEIATDKVDSEIPSPVDGILSDILYEENARVPVGTVIAVVDLASDDAVPEKPEKQDTDVKTEVKIEKKTLEY
jgi:2-oxoglutarate dehydrogenase E2 component (dihydrolipoamide succinyltransferase)